MPRAGHRDRSTASNRPTTSKNPACLRIESSPIHPSQWNQKGGELARFLEALLGRISKMGNRYLRKLLVVGAHAVLYHRNPHQDALRSFAKKILQAKPFKLVPAALANKMARIAFPIMRGRTTYSAAPA